MKVLLLNNFHYRRGGSETVYLNTGSILEKHGHQVIYFSQKWDMNIPCENSMYFPDGIDFQSNGLRNKIKGICRYFYNRNAAENLERLIQDEHPDIAHVHLLWGGLSPSVLRVLKRHDIPIVHTAHDYRMVCPGYTFKDSRDRICEQCREWNFAHCIIHKCAKGNLLMSIIMTLEMYFRNIFFNPVKYISAFVFVSRFSKERHVDHNRHFLNSRNEILYNFSNADIMSMSGDMDTYDSYYLYYGRLSYEKGINTLIEAFSQYPHQALKIVGTGPLETALKEKCEKLGMNDIEFIGYKTGPELYALVANAKFVVVPSEWYENNPMTIVESYTLKTPVIGAAIGGIPEIIDDGHTGYLFESGNIRSLSTVIGRSINMGSREYQDMKNAAHDFALRKFNPDRYYEKLMSLYTELLGRI